MARIRKKHNPPPAELPMTPMIDVVFQLLVYFIVTLKPVDIFAHLDVNRPSPEARQREMQTPPRMIRIGIFAEGYTINDRPVSIQAMEEFVREMGDLDPTQTVLIMCSGFAPHESLIRVLDICSKYSLSNLSVISTN